ncbi:MAG: ABC transporter substrate-binding protein [Chloroflexi bacterium]|nr:ABC transporter substrate-binding protein [Chloroflexota bacterium]
MSRKALTSYGFVIVILLAIFSAFAVARDLQKDPLVAEVEAGNLPPLEERLPNTPLVVGPGLLMPEEALPDWEPGQHGGTLRTAFTSAFGFSGELFVMNVEPIVAAPDIDVEGFYGNVAESFEVNDDATVFTFTLREGLKWSDGTPVTTADVAFVFNDLYNNGEYGAFPNKFKSASGSPAELAVVDDYTFSLSFDVPSGGILRDLAITGWTSYNDMIKPAHYLGDYHPSYADADELAAALEAEGLSAEEWPILFNNKDCPRFHIMREKCIGFPQLSPWVVTELSESGTIMQRNPYYWKVDTEGKQLPYLDTLVAQVFGDGEMVNLGAIAGDIDFLYGTQYSNFPLYKENEESGNYVTIPLILHADPTALYIQTCNNDPAFVAVADDVRFRRGLSHAIDREEIIDVIYLGLGSIPTWIPAEFDPDLANQLLDEMGMDQRDGDGYRMSPAGESFTLYIEVAPVRPDMIPVAELIVDHLGAFADIRAEMRQEDPNVKNERIANNETQSSIHWIQTYQWRPGMNQEYASSSQWCASWRSWLDTGGASGTEPPAEVKRLYEIRVARKATVPYSEADLALVDELFALHYDNVWILPMIENVLRPTIFNADFGNIATSGTQMGASRAGEQYFYRTMQ